MKRIYFSYGKAGKFDGDKGIERPRFGYNWFFFLPNFVYNGGNPFKKEVFDFHINWLCFWVGITIYGN